MPGTCGADARSRGTPGGGAARAGVAGAGPVGPADRPPERGRCRRAGRPRAAAPEHRCTACPVCAALRRRARATAPTPWPRWRGTRPGCSPRCASPSPRRAPEARRRPRRSRAGTGPRRAAHPGRARAPATGVAVLTVGVDVGGTRVRAGVVDAEGEIIDTARTSTPRSEEALEAAVAGGRRGARAAARRRRGRAGAGRVRHAGPARRPVRPAPGVARRAGRRPDRGPARPAGRRRARRERRGARRAAVRRRRRARRRWCSSPSAPGSAPHC